MAPKIEHSQTRAVYRAVRVIERTMLTLLGTRSTKSTQKYCRKTLRSHIQYLQKTIDYIINARTRRWHLKRSKHREKVRKCGKRSSFTPDATILRLTIKLAVVTLTRPIIDIKIIVSLIRFAISYPVRASTLRLVLVPDNDC